MLPHSVKVTIKTVKDFYYACGKINMDSQGRSRHQRCQAGKALKNSKKKVITYKKKNKFRDHLQRKKQNFMVTNSVRVRIINK